MVGKWRVSAMVRARRERPAPIIAMVNGEFAWLGRGEAGDGGWSGSSPLFVVVVVG